MILSLGSFLPVAEPLISMADSSFDCESEFPVLSSVAEAEQHDMLQIEMDV